MRFTVLCLAVLALAACGGPSDDPAVAAPPSKDQAKEMPIVPDIEQRLAKFSPTPL